MSSRFLSALSDAVAGAGGGVLFAALVFAAAIGVTLLWWVLFALGAALALAGIAGSYAVNGRAQR